MSRLYYDIDHFVNKHSPHTQEAVHSSRFLKFSRNTPPKIAERTIWWFTIAMLRPHERLTDVVPRLQSLYEKVSPAEPLILYYEPRSLHDKATRAVSVAKNARQTIELGTEIVNEWSARGVIREDTQADEPTDSELRRLMAEEYDKLAHEAKDELAEK